LSFASGAWLTGRHLSLHVFVDVTSAILREIEFGTKVVGSTVTVLAIALKRL
jgi:hypothetical protein